MEEAFPWTPPEHIAQLPPYVQGILITANDFHRGPVYSCPTCRERYEECEALLAVLEIDLSV